MNSIQPGNNVTQPASHTVIKRIQQHDWSVVNEKRNQTNFQTVRNIGSSKRGETRHEFHSDGKQCHKTWFANREWKRNLPNFRTIRKFCSAKVKTNQNLNDRFPADRFRHPKTRTLSHCRHTMALRLANQTAFIGTWGNVHIAMLE